MLKINKYLTYAWDFVQGMYTNVVKSKYIEPHNHTFYEISITKKGNYVNHFNTGDVVFTPYTMAIIRSRDIHYIESDFQDDAFRIPACAGHPDRSPEGTSA